MMKGSGTKENPFLVETVYDLQDVRDTSDSTTYYKLVADLDFNNHDTYKNGVTLGDVIINAQNSVLDGDGHIISNINYRGAVGSTTKKPSITLKLITNTVLKNFVISVTRTSSGFSDGFFDCEIDRCSIAVELLSSALSFFKNRRDNLTKKIISNCTFSVYGSGDRYNGLDMMSMYLERCQIDLVDYKLYTIGYGFVANGSGSGGLKNVYFTGNAIAPPETVSNVNLINSTNADAVYFAVSIAGIKDIKLYLQLTCISTCFVVTDIIEGLSGYSSKDAKCHLITDAQARDTSYLLSIGFPVVPA